MRKLRIVAVEYINTLPFLFGLNNASLTEPFDIVTVNPANCAKLFKSGEADVALVPVGALEDMPEYELITEYCIGSDGAVDTVALLSNEPIEQLKQIVLDDHSRTSAMLIRLICQHYWQIQLAFTNEVSQTDHVGYLFIGDKVKEKESEYQYKYDLGAVWKEWTGLPMVFAVWIAKPTVAKSFQNRLNDAFEYAVNHLEAVPLIGYDNQSYWQNYLQQSIRYPFDARAKAGMTHFLNMKKQLV